MILYGSMLLPGSSYSSDHKPGAMLALQIHSRGPEFVTRLTCRFRDASPNQKTMFGQNSPYARSCRVLHSICCIGFAAVESLCAGQGEIIADDMSSSWFAFPARKETPESKGGEGR